MPRSVIFCYGTVKPTQLKKTDRLFARSLSFNGTPKRFHMKLNFTLLLLFVSVSFCEAQIRKIPAEVTEAFKSRYPHGEQVSWKDNISNFEAGFILNGYLMKADFNGKGEWLESEKKLRFEELPIAVQDGFSKCKYADWEKTAVVELEKNSEALQYRILVKKSTVQKKYLFFDANGKLLRDTITI